MALPDIYAAFQAAARDGLLTGNAPDGLADVLSSLGLTTLPVANGDAKLGPDSAWLTGTTTFLTPSMTWTLRLTGRVGNNPAQPNRAALVLELDLAAQTTPWTFESAFDALPRSRRPKAGSSGGGLVLGPSVVDPLVLEAPRIVAVNDPFATFYAPRLSGTLPLRGRSDAPDSDLLAGYAPYFGDTLRAEGTVTFGTGPAPVIELHAVSPDAELALGGLSVAKVGIRLTTNYPDPSFLPDPGAPLSAALLSAEVTLPDKSKTTAKLEGPLLIGDYVWPLEILFDTPLAFGDAIQALAEITGVGASGDFKLPEGIPLLDEFGLSDLGFGVVPISRGGPGLSYVSVGIKSKRPWDPPVPYLTIDEVGTRWSFTFRPGGTPLVVGTVYGTMGFHQKAVSSLGATPSYADRVERGLLPPATLDDVRVTVQLSLPDLAFTVFTVDPFDLPIADAFTRFFGQAPPGLGPKLTVESFSAMASLPRKEFAAGLSVSGNWSIGQDDPNAVVLTLEAIEMQVAVSQSKVSGRLQGRASIALPDGANPIGLIARAERPETGDWEFAAILDGELNLVRLVYGLVRTKPPEWIDTVNLKVAGLEIWYSTADGKPYSASGTFKAALHPKLLGFDMSLEVTAAVERRRRLTLRDEMLALALRGSPQVGETTVTVGSLSGTFTINQLIVSASVSVTDAGQDYTFEIAYRDVSLKAATSRVSTGGTEHQIITVSLTGTLGNLVTYLVSLANPNANFRLEPPWDFLNTIDLSGLALVIDPTLQSVSVTYDLTLDLGFIAITAIGLRYDRSTGVPRVMFTLKARMVGDTAAKPLDWDAVNQSPPSVPGKGQGLFYLRYLGLGQHVVPKDIASKDSITGMLDALVKTMRPVDPAKGKPPIDPAVMRFDASSQWLFGIDASVMDTVSLQLLMQDPDLFGIVVSLGGPKAKVLAGLKVELLYKKVTEDIGVFHARLQIPTAFRQLQLGAVSVTLGTITADIYTNGSFRVDLGFPHNRDFTNSFAIEAGIFSGRGGIYFGVLDAATSTRVPRITNGTFSPVIELGVGLSVGVGRTFEAGPLKAGLYVNLLVIFEGALAWFQPDDESESETYYWCRGVAGIVGKIYGSVDFAIIRVDVSVEVAAMASLELEAYKSTLVELSLLVRVNASVTVVFFTVSFSFELSLSQSFTIGADTTPPWRIAAGTSVRRRLHPDALRALAGPAARQADGYRLRFDKDARVFPGGETRTIRLTLVPAFTVAGVPVNWSGDGIVPPNADPAYRLVVMLVADNAVPPDAVTIADTHRPDVSRSAHALNASGTSFNQVAEGMLRWSLNALGVTSPAATVTRADLDELDRQLGMAESSTVGFTWENLQGFLTNNLHAILSSKPAASSDAKVIGGTPFPMLPLLRWTSPDLPDPAQRTRAFWEYQKIDATYQAEALAYFENLDPRPAVDRPAAADRLVAEGEPAESMATFVLRDYFRLVARAATQAAVNLLGAFPYEVGPNDSLGSIANGFPTSNVRYEVVPGDSVERVAERLGMSARELVALNPNLPEMLAAARPGATLTIVIGVTAQSIAVGNPDWPVASNATVTLGTLTVQVKPGDTIERLAGQYGVKPDALLVALLEVKPLLRPGAAVPLPNVVYQNPTGRTIPEAAAIFYVRLGMVRPEEVEFADWYTQAIYRLNRSVGSGSLPESLVVPTGYEHTATTIWRTLPGDRVIDVAAYAALSQHVIAGTPYAEWLTDFGDANDPPLPSGIALPETALATVLPTDSIDSLRARVLVDPVEFDKHVKTAAVLEPLMTVAVPGASATTPPGLTLLTLAQTYGLGLEDLAGRIADDPGVLATDSARTLTIPNVPAITLTDLVSELHTGKPMATICGQVARFMMSGLRLPAPVLVDGKYHAIGPMTGAYELIGQQVTSPAPPTGIGADEQPVVTITVDKGLPADWLTFANSVVLDADGAGAFAARNPALAHRRDVAGIVALADDAADAVLAITASELRDKYPATGLAPVVVSAPAALRPYHEIGIRYPVTGFVAWQTTVAPSLPTKPPSPATPSLWSLPADLITKAAGGESASRFLLEQATPQAGQGQPYAELGSYAWGTLIAFATRRIPGLHGTVEVLGADASDRKRLALLLDYLGAVSGKPRDASFQPCPDGERARLQLLWRLPATPGMRPGLSSVALHDDATFIVQTNLTTETRSANVGATAVSGVHFASIADAPRFLTLLWECSVVGGGGYWLQIRGADMDVPTSIFDQDGFAQFTLLVQLESQSTSEAAKGWPIRKLLAFNDCAVVGDAVDPGSVALSARPMDPGELRRESSVRPGQVGFGVELSNPGLDDTPEGHLRRLYGLLGYQLLPTSVFSGSGEGRPVNSRPRNSADDLGLPIHSPADEQFWSLTRVVDINRFALTHLPSVPTAPAVAADPYAGIVRGAATSVSLWFVDAFGNISARREPLPVPARYTDPVVGIGAWPSTTARYTIERAGPQAEIAVAVDFQALAYQPAAHESGAVMVEKAARDSSRLAPVYFQLMQGDVEAVLLTSLRQKPGGEPDRLPVDVDGLRRFVMAAHAFLGSISTLGPRPATETKWLDDVCESYGVDYDALAAANADAVLADMLDAASLDVPVGRVFRNCDTVALICAELDPPGNAYDVLVDEDNVVLPLSPGVEVSTPPQMLDVPAHSPGAADLAASFKCSLGRLVAANEHRPGLLTPGFVFECNGIKVGIDTEEPWKEATLAGVASTFQDNGVPYDALQVVTLNADRPGMFRAAQRLVVDGYIIEAGDTLLTNRGNLSPEDLAPLNAETVNLFPPGTPLQVTTVATAVKGRETLATFAAVHGTTPQALLRHNGNVRLGKASKPVVPGTWSWPTGPHAVRVPYTIQPGDALADVSRHFLSGTARLLGTLNASMPGTIAAGVTIQVGATSVTTGRAESFAGVCGLFDPVIELDALIAAVDGRTDVLAPGALLVCPPGVLPRATPPEWGITPAEAARVFGVTPAVLLGANAGTPGMLVPGQVLLASTDGDATETTAPYDTLTAIIGRFQRRGISTDVSAITRANADIPFLYGEATVLVPPATAQVRGTIGEATAEGTRWTFPAPLFPILVAVELSRDPALVDPDLAATATSDRTIIPAACSADGTERGALTLAAFSAQVEAAIPALRLATGRELPETDVWAVVFDDEGISSVSVYPPVTVSGIDSPQPRTFAIRPLSTTLFAREHVATKAFDVTKGTLSHKEIRNYQGVDLEVWARDFLADVELMLSAPYVRGTYALNRPAIDGIVQAKKTLAGAIAEGLDYVLSGQSPAGTDGKRAAAIEALRQRLLVSLTGGYDTAAVLQYDTDVATSWRKPYARLSGNPIITFDQTTPRTATLSNGKVSLAAGADQVNFLLSVPETAAHKTVDLSLDYRVVELEYGIRPQIDGYEQSDWLTFTTSVENGSPNALDVRLGAPRVPLPLRAYPPLPILVDQQAVVPSEAAALEDALHWRYRCAIRHQSAEQDLICFRVTYNGGSDATIAAEEEDLFGALAQYNAVSTPLLGLLTRLVDWEKETSEQQSVLAAALGTCTTLMASVATAWVKHWGEAPGGVSSAATGHTELGAGPELEAYNYSMSLEAEGKHYTMLCLTCEASGQVGWPEITCVTIDGTRYQLMPAPPVTTSSTPPARSRCYTFPVGEVRAFELLTFVLTFPEVHVAAYQNATSRVWVTRNARLLGDEGPETSADFVYRTPEVSYATPVVPFIDITGAIPIDPWPSAPLEPMFLSLFNGDPANRRIAFGARYGYPLVLDEPSLEAFAPVIQSTVGNYDGTTVPAIRTSLDTWLQKSTPAAEGAGWAFRVCLYSSLDPSLQRPILLLKHLSSSLTSSKPRPALPGLTAFLSRQRQ